MKRNTILLFVVSFLVWACSENTSGGPSSVETQNAVLGTVVDSVGLPIEGARVSLQKAYHSMTDSIRQSFTDEQGEFHFSISDSSLYVVEFSDEERKLGGRYFSRGILVDQEDSIAPTIVLNKSNQIVLQRESMGWRANDELQLHLLGSDQNYTWPANQNLNIPIYSPGVYAFVAKAKGEERSLIKNIDAYTDTLTLNFSTQKEFLLTDFEIKCNLNHLAYLLGDSWGFQIFESWNENNTHLDERLLTCVEEEGNQVYYSSWQMDSASTWAAAGFTLGLANEGVDLSKLESIRLKIKGKGLVDFGLITKEVIPYEDYRFPTFNRLRLDSIWSWVELPVSELSIEAGSQAEQAGLTWDSGKEKVLHLQWEYSKGTEIYLDSIVLTGMEYSDFIVE